MRSSIRILIKIYYLDTQPSLIVPFPALMTPLSANKFPNKLGTNAPSVTY